MVDDCATVKPVVQVYPKLDSVSKSLRVCSRLLPFSVRNKVVGPGVPVGTPTTAELTKTPSSLVLSSEPFSIKDVLTL